MSERKTMKAGKGCTAFIVVKPNGTANVHILSKGLNLSVLGARITKKQGGKV